MELISFVLPGRDRKACKNKFKAEDKRNPRRITHCLKNRLPYGIVSLLCRHLQVFLTRAHLDIETLSLLTGKDFSGPTPQIQAPVSIDEPSTTAESEPPTTAPLTPEAELPDTLVDIYEM